MFVKFTANVGFEGEVLNIPTKVGIRGINLEKLLPKLNSWRFYASIRPHFFGTKNKQYVKLDMINIALGVCHA